MEDFSRAQDVKHNSKCTKQHLVHIYAMKYMQLILVYHDAEWHHFDLGSSTSQRVQDVSREVGVSACVGQKHGKKNSKRFLTQLPGTLTKILFAVGQTVWCKTTTWPLMEVAMLDQLLRETIYEIQVNNGEKRTPLTSTSETTTCIDKVILIHVGHNVPDGSLQGVLGSVGMLGGLPLNDALDVANLERTAYRKIDSNASNANSDNAVISSDLQSGKLGVLPLWNLLEPIMEPILGTILPIGTLWNLLLEPYEMYYGTILSIGTLWNLLWNLLLEPIIMESIIGTYYWNNITYWNLMEPIIGTMLPIRCHIRDAKSFLPFFSKWIKCDLTPLYHWAPGVPIANGVDGMDLKQFGSLRPFH
ncbi:hypothetical protein GQR58_020213 [Nymphon striatum]|nr:hypothetical protein GQR58_020213 [Nymphon striatum]